MARNRILVVEDDESIHKVIVKNLTAAGYAVFSCFDGEQAAKTISQDEDFDLALLDVMLPGIDGFALLDTRVMSIRQKPTLRPVATTAPVESSFCAQMCLTPWKVT